MAPLSPRDLRAPNRAPLNIHRSAGHSSPRPPHRAGNLPPRLISVVLGWWRRLPASQETASTAALGVGCLWTSSSGQATLTGTHLQIPHASLPHGPGDGAVGDRRCAHSPPDLFLGDLRAADTGWVSGGCGACPGPGPLRNQRPLVSQDSSGRPRQIQKDPT